MKCLKRIGVAAMLMAALALLSGCDAGIIRERALVEADASAIPASYDVPEADGAEAREETAYLYFFSADGGTLVPELREIRTGTASDSLRATLRALLEGPMEGEGTWPRLDYDPDAVRLEVSGRVAVVDLPARFRQLEPVILFAVRQTVAETLTTAGMDYVNVLIGGREEGMDLAGLIPAGTFSRMSDADIAAQYALGEELRQSAQGFSRLTTLYLPAGDGLLMPTVRSVRYDDASPVEYLYQLLSELGQVGLQDAGVPEIPAPLLYVEEMPEIVRSEDGAYRVIRLQLSEDLRPALEGARVSLETYLAMLTHTLMGFVPGMDGLQVRLGDALIDGLPAEDTNDGATVEFEDGLLTRDCFPDALGAPLTLYERGQRAGMLRRRTEIVPQDEAGQLRAALECLLRLPDEDSALPEGLTAADVLAVYETPDAVLVNLTGRLRDTLLMLPQDAQALAMWAMTNTLTETTDAQDVVFFFDGVQIDGAENGIIFRGKLHRNPGVVER